MEKDFKSMLELRCENGLMNNERYREIQKELAVAYDNKDIDTYSELTIEMQRIIQVESYKLCFKDTFGLLV